MSRSSRRRRNRHGFFANLFRGVFGDAADARKRKKAARTTRFLAFEACEDRRLLAVTAAWDGTDTITLVGDTSDDAVSVVGQKSYVDIYVSGKFQGRFTSANSSNVANIKFSGGAGTDSLTVLNIKPTGGTLNIGTGGVGGEAISGVETVSVVNSSGNTAVVVRCQRTR
jgi:hypothetical protein